MPLSTDTTLPAYADLPPATRRHAALSTSYRLRLHGRTAFASSADPGRALFPVLRLVGPPPRVPTLIFGEGERERTFRDLPALAVALHTQRKGRPIRLARRGQVRADGGAAFPAIDVFVVGHAGDEDWLCAAAIQSSAPERLRSALDHEQPEHGGE